jgi:hypothetical protein
VRHLRESLRKTAFLSHLYIKTIILPRQARDKHRENTKKNAVFRTVREQQRERSPRHDAERLAVDCDHDERIRAQVPAQDGNKSVTRDQQIGRVRYDQTRRRVQTCGATT